MHGKTAKNKEKKRINHSSVVILIGFAATFLAIIISSVGIFRGLESRSIDWRFKARGVIKPQAPVVIVAIDDESFASMPERWVWPRHFYARLVSNLKKLGAKAVGFDVIYSEPTARNPKEDAAFAEAVKKAGNVTLGMAVLYEENDKGSRTKALLPIQPLAEAAKSLGLIQHVYDEDTNIRRSYFLVDEGDKRYYSMSAELLSTYYGLDKTDLVIKDGNACWGKFKIPLYEGNMVLVNFAGPSRTFETVPFYKVYYNEGIKPGQFKDKIVLVGSTAELLHDVFVTPFATYGEKMPGVEIHANVINTIFNSSYIYRMNALSGFVLLITIGLLTSFLLFRIQAWQGLIVASAEIAAYTMLSQYLFNSYNYIIDFVNPVFCVALCYLSISTYKVGVEEREKRKIKSLFSKYVSDVLVEDLVAGGELKLGGEKKEISVLFSDIRGFTSMSEKMQPEEVVSLLNEYLSEMTESIFTYGGMLDKFVGDAVMALFGTPAPLKDHALQAVRTAFDMKKRLARLNEKWAAEGRPQLKIGIGINSGPAVAGNMGSLKRMEYTVIGDTVNLASRLESATKSLDAGILVSEKTYNMVSGFVKARKIEGVTVKGKEEALTVYDLLELV